MLELERSVEIGEVLLIDEFVEHELSNRELQKILNKHRFHRNPGFLQNCVEFAPILWRFSNSIETRGCQNTKLCDFFHPRVRERSNAGDHIGDSRIVEEMSKNDEFRLI